LLNNVIRNLRVLCQRAELGDQAAEVTFHDLRRACLTNLAESGMAIHELKAVAGHASVTTTEKHYLRVRRARLDHVRDVANKMVPVGRVE
jgi:integrase